MDSIFRTSSNIMIRVTLAEKNEVLFMTILVWIPLFREIFGGRKVKMAIERQS
jgi:hypothetical protein